MADVIKWTATIMLCLYFVADMGAQIKEALFHSDKVDRAAGLISSTLHVFAIVTLLLAAKYNDQLTAAFYGVMK
jgi:hypothetical protein